MSKGCFVVPEKSGDLVCLDLIALLPIGRGGASQLFVVVDAFSKYRRLYALRRATTKAILNKILNDNVRTVKKPKYILSDNGT